MNMAARLADKEPEISLRSWWRPNTELKEEGVMDLDSAGEIIDHIHVKDHVAL